MKLSTVWREVETHARALGALRAGASPLGDEHAHLFDEWIANGHEASMAYLRKNRDARLDPAARFPWARSVIAIAVPYSSERRAESSQSFAAHIARYALGDDYHGVLDRMLREIEARLHELAPEVQTRRYVDTGPLSDRAYGAQGGLGWIGRNGMLIDPDHGSYFFIGTLLTSLEPDLDVEEITDRCGACTRCLDACPTSAILTNRTVASEHCLSYVTIEHRGPIDPRIAERLEGNAFGCDICQEVCPWNAAPAPSHPSFEPREEYRARPIHDLLRFNQADFSSLFRNSAVKRAKLEGMRRNVEMVVRSP
ncbi:MAG TPA: tRNA epoxyqueuosine(34) reductase QueG [Thermoanaerobaculia bacterium]